MLDQGRRTPHTIPTIARPRAARRFRTQRPLGVIAAGLAAIASAALLLTGDQRRRRAVPGAGLVAVASAALLLAACAPGAASPARTALRAAFEVEPAPAAAFIAAYAGGDEAAAERLASPLYRAEWARRGASVADRLALLPRWYREVKRPGQWLYFTYVGGVVDTAGFGHLLYTTLPAQPASPDSRPIPTVWRVDTDPDGRAIWAEMVWLFDEGTALTRVAGPLDAAGLDLPPALAARQPRLLMGVRASHGRGGYYALGLTRDDRDGGPAPAAPHGPQGPATTASAPDPAADAPHRVLFVAVDGAGDVRPGAWSYGQPESPLVAQGYSQTGQSPAPRPTVALEPADLRLWRTYLAALP